jgi:hypothetical protein
VEQPGRRAAAKGGSVAGPRGLPYEGAVPSRALLLAVALLPTAVRAQDEDETFSAPPPDEDRIHVTAMGGALFDLRGSGETYSFVGGEVAYSFEQMDIGILAQGYRLGQRATSLWSPVVMARFLQRFETRKGLEATFGVGLGAGKTDTWRGWYQLALGMRLIEGPLFIQGELGFEQLDLFRLGGGIGFRF